MWYGQLGRCSSDTESHLPPWGGSAQFPSGKQPQGGVAFTLQTSRWVGKELGCSLLCEPLYLIFFQRVQTHVERIQHLSHLEVIYCYLHWFCKY